MRILLLALLFCQFLFSEPTTLIIVRHGQTDWNKEKIMQGHSDIPLNSLGHEQAEKFSKILIKEHPDIVAIYSSDLSRAVQTAEKIAKQLQLEITKTSKLREVNHGVAEGLPHDVVHSLYGKKFEQFYANNPDRKTRWNYTSIPEAETYQQVLDRAKPEVIKIAEAHPGKKVAIFSHGRAIRTLIEDATDGDVGRGLSNCEVAYFTYENGQLKFIKLEKKI